MLLVAATVGTAAQDRVVALDVQAMLRDLERLSADDMEGRAAGTEGGARARALLVARLAAAGLAPLGDSFEHPFTFGPAARRGVNIVGAVRGTTDPDRFLVVSAHYDHVGVRNGRVYNGANDNASGAAALPAIAAHFVAHRPRTSLLVVAFDAEEEGLLGSRAFVRAPPVPLASLLANVNLDMIGRDPDNRLWVAGTRQFPLLRPLVAQVAQRAPVDLRMGYDDPALGRDRDWTRDSDQWAFIERGIPALYVGVEDFGLHHDPDDDYASMTLDFYASAVRTIVDLVGELSRQAEALSASRPR